MVAAVLLPCLLDWMLPCVLCWFYSMLVSITVLHSFAFAMAMRKKPSQAREHLSKGTLYFKQCNFASNFHISWTHLCFLALPNHWDAPQFFCCESPTHLPFHDLRNHVLARYDTSKLGISLFHWVLPKSFFSTAGGSRSLLLLCIPCTVDTDCYLEFWDCLTQSALRTQLTMASRSYETWGKLQAHKPKATPKTFNTTRWAL